MTGSFKIQLINMGTRAAACEFQFLNLTFSFSSTRIYNSYFFPVQAKLRCLHDYHLRLLHNVLPAPSGIDIANTIKYFSQTFLSEYTFDV